MSMPILVGDAVVASANPKTIETARRKGTRWAPNPVSQWWCEDEGLWVTEPTVEGTVLATYAGVCYFYGELKTVPIVVIKDHEGPIYEVRSDLYRISHENTSRS